MHKSIRIFLLMILLLCSKVFEAQQISILTCSKGKEIYSTFGHSAIRYSDTSKNIDWVYNYGIFEYSDPLFIPKFINGKLDYMVAKEPFKDFYENYKYQGRAIEEQILNLDTNDIKTLYKFLEWNILDENKYYRYDFLKENCATKIIDILEQHTKIKINFFKEKNDNSYRQLIHSNAKNSTPFIDWGMDIGIGKRCDYTLTPKEYTFLPEYVSKSIDNTINTKLNQNLVKLKQTILKGDSKIVNNSFFSINKILIICLFSLLIIQIFLKNIFTFFKYLILTIIFIGSIIVLYLWLFTEHNVTKYNFNLLWLNPIIGAYLLLGNNKLLLKKVKFWYSLSLIIMVLLDFFNIQNFQIESFLMAGIIYILMGYIFIYKKITLNREVK